MTQQCSAANRHCSNKPRWRRGMRAAVRRLLPPPAAWHPLCVSSWANVCLLCVSMNTQHIHRVARYCYYHRFTFTWLAQLCAVFTCLVVPSGGRTADDPSCYDSTDPLGVIAETHTVLLPGAALCSVMVSCRFEEEPYSKACQRLIVAVVSFCFLLLNVSNVFTLHTSWNDVSVLVQSQILTHGASQRGLASQAFIPQTLKWNSTVTKTFHGQLPSLEMEMIC